MLCHDLSGSVRNLIDRCSGCGFCRAVCPSLGQLGWESASPRGRIYLAGMVLSERMPLTPEVSARIDQCLLCRNCLSVCPVGLRIDQVIMAVRSLQRKTTAMAGGKQAVLFLLAQPRLLLGMVTSVFSVLERIAFRRKAGNGALFRLSGKTRLLPMLGGRPLLSQYQDIEAGEPVRKVAFFTGCYVNYAGTNIGRAVINVLVRNGCSVTLPREQVCCGVPFFASGETDQATAMVRHNIDVLSSLEVDAIVYACGSCGTGLREWADYPEMDPAYREKAQVLKKKVFEIGEYLLDKLEVSQLPAMRKPTRITYHDSCHLAVSGVQRQPRRLLQLMGNVDYVELPDARSCCGNAGLFSLTHYPLSRRINEKKIQAIRAVAPDIVTSGCPGCNLHMADGLHRQGDERTVLSHYIEVLNNAYECTPESDP